VRARQALQLVSVTNGITVCGIKVPRKELTAIAEDGDEEVQDDSAFAAEATAWLKLAPEERIAILTHLAERDLQWPCMALEYKQVMESLVAERRVICTMG